ncbi:MAG: phosphoribosylanthranilate isomerase, partial [Roseovarius sp.]
SQLRTQLELGEDADIDYSDLATGEALFNLGQDNGFAGGAYSCGRCHTRGWSIDAETAAPETADLDQIDRYAGVADQLLIDAKPPPGATRPGGNALAFDWGLIEGRDWPLPWLLAGGLTPETVADAIARTGARQIDVSSGVEVSPGRKDPALIRAFIAAARGV